MKVFTSCIKTDILFRFSSLGRLSVSISCFCGSYGVGTSFWDGLELELWMFSFLFHFLCFSSLKRLSLSISTLVQSFWCNRTLLGWSGARVMNVFILVSLFEFLRPREVVCEHLQACALILVQTRASGMVWGLSYEGFSVYTLFEHVLFLKPF